MQILHPFTGSVQQYLGQLADPDQHRPDHCPQCRAKHPLTAHGFYTRTIVDAAFDGLIRVRRYLCETCRRTVSLLPQFALPLLTFQRHRDRPVPRRPTAPGRKLSPTRCRHRRLTSAASSGCAASARKPRPCAPRWPR